jgi:hypothetical protein
MTLSIYDLQFRPSEVYSGIGISNIRVLQHQKLLMLLQSSREDYNKFDELNALNNKGGLDNVPVTKRDTVSSRIDWLYYFFQDASRYFSGGLFWDFGYGNGQTLGVAYSAGLSVGGNEVQERYANVAESKLKRIFPQINLDFLLTCNSSQLTSSGIKEFTGNDKIIYYSYPWDQEDLGAAIDVLDHGDHIIIYHSDRQVLREFYPIKGLSLVASRVCVQYLVSNLHFIKEAHIFDSDAPANEKILNQCTIGIYKKT